MVSRLQWWAVGLSSAGPSTVLPDFALLSGSGNALGEEGCEQLQEVLDSFNMAKVLASLR